MKHRVFILIVTLLCILFGLHGYAGATGQEFIPVPLEIPHAVGVGVGIYPDYEGSDDYNFGAAPLFNYQFGERYIRLIANYLSVNLINNENFRLGPSGLYRFGRDDDVDDDVVKRMEEIDDSIEIGGFAGVNYVHPTNPRIRAGATIESLFDVSGSHDGYIIQFSARGWYPLLKMLDFGMAVGSTYASNDYMETYFGVSPEDSARTGLPTFDAGSGVKDVYIQAMAAIHLGRSWHIGIGARYKGLISDASDSPVVDDRGSANQFIAGAGLIFSW